MLQYRFATRHRVPQRDKNQQCWWLQACCVGWGQPSSLQCPPKKSPLPSPDSEKKVALRIKKKKFLSFFSVSWLFGPHPCSRQQMSPSSVLCKVLVFVQLTPETCSQSCIWTPFHKTSTIWEHETSPDVPRLEKISSVTLGSQGGPCHLPPIPSMVAGQTL